MADDVDKSSEKEAILEEAAIISVRLQAASIESGFEGDCDKCGNSSPRLMGYAFFKKRGYLDVAEDIDQGICPRCRDKHKLP